jgi:dihydrofolate synthase/folylpolyglutamate synthase
LTQVLIDQGQSVGTFTSPHLENICERIRINGKPISEEDFILAYHLANQVEGSPELTRFEFLALMAWKVFSGQVPTIQKVDKIVLEAGIGGRKDATRAFPYENVVVTKLGLDHTELLGDTLEQIETEKMAVIHHELKYPSILLEQPIQKFNMEYRCAVQFDKIEIVKALRPMTLVTYKGRKISLGIPFQVGSDAAALALEWVEQAQMSVEKTLSSLEKVSWPGRYEFFESSIGNVLLSGDHNPQGISLLVRNLKNYESKPKRFVLGVSLQKDLSKILSILLELDAEIILTQTPFKSRQSVELEGLTNGQIKYVPDAAKALRQARHGLSRSEMVVVTGSLYLVGLLRSQLTSEVAK